MPTQTRFKPEKVAQMAAEGEKSVVAVTMEAVLAVEAAVAVRTAGRRDALRIERK